MERRNQILLAAAEWLDDGRQPFCDEFLIEHEVTLDECFALSSQLALGARMVVNTMQDALRGGVFAQSAGMSIAMAEITAGRLSDKARLK